MAELEERGQPPAIRNLIKPTIDLVLGTEAKNRRDWRVVAEIQTGDNEMMAEALSVKLKEAARMSNADRALSDAYKGQVLTGLDWVYVGRNWDPFGPPYVVEPVHRREIWWDWRVKSTDVTLERARYLIRKQWFDEDLLLEVFPEHADLIRYSLTQGGPNSWDWDRFDWAPLMANAMTSLRRTTIDEMEWRQATTDRRRGCLFEVWYRLYRRGLVFHGPNKRVFELDPGNTAHQAYLATTGTVPRPAVIPKVRLAWYLGPFRLADIDNPNPFNRFPYQGFWGSREDRTGVPYGLGRSMLWPQDEVNARHSKMLWGLNAKRVKGDADAPADKNWQRLMHEASRPDAMIQLNPNRKNPGQSIDIETDFQLNEQQFKVLQDSVKAIQDVAGVYQEQLGKGRTGQSGVAIAQLVEQGSATLAEINDNFADAKREVGEMLLALVHQDLMTEREVDVMVGDAASSRKTVTLNHYVEENPGVQRIENNLITLKARVALTETPSSATYKTQQFQTLGEIIKSLPESIQVALVPMWLEGSDHPRKDEMAEMVRKALGQSEDAQPPDPAQQQAQDLEAQMAQAEIALKEAQALLAQSKAEAESIMARARAAELAARTAAARTAPSATGLVPDNREVMQ